MQEMKDSYVMKLKEAVAVTTDVDSNLPQSNQSLYQEFKKRRFVRSVIIIHSLKTWCISNKLRFEEMKRGDLTFDQKSKLVGEEWRDMQTRTKKVNT